MTASSVAVSARLRPGRIETPGNAAAAARLYTSEGALEKPGVIA
jgi:hypothetical protein